MATKSHGKLAEPRAYQSGDIVSIYPHGHQERAARAEVLARTASGALALLFSEKPPFAKSMLGPRFAEPLLGRESVGLFYRYSIGPWIDVVGGGHFEIEPVATGAAGK